ncbi:UDP-N-acetylglucosamine diphosphorylase/glucosamine-1-phosphate N-acetyltransferase [Wolbachia pipientis]|uniref:Bifunctional protein GlmU n=1 Tax=Wolbachia pipientis TaxID=955 RepID=A0A1E7QKV8_WOLPI|nr:bifunctional UDP-N-acetylglucosamine diphosphorylase/glucosamine-1-phosphate N-acetyltransferase GlmU [Wolbachia pipientis]OEY86849.1 UDP-N-acetylglucosamine diphosphorylase/glucosamine-1-phosphate N-acetyltransferase [Wolbachia pipientis]
MNKVHTVIVLAAGYGKRMNSNLPKVLHKIGNFPMLEHVIFNAKQLAPENIVIVVNQSLRENLSKLSDIELITQESILGTGYAVRTALHNLTELRDLDIIVVQYGDTPLIKSSTIIEMIDILQNKALVCLGFKSHKPEYGRLIIENGALKAIVEAQNDTVKREYLANAGVIVAYAKELHNLVRKIERKHEYHLTDIVSIAATCGLEVGYVVTDEAEGIGINNRDDLIKAEVYFQEDKRKLFTDLGVTLVSPKTLFFSLDTQIFKDTVVDPYVFFGPGVTVQSEVRILSFSHLEHCVIMKGATIGPFARIRKNTTIDDHAIVGNFVEIKKSNIQRNVKIKHLSYIGDTEIGHGSNIGAGTIVCNYDGKNKHKTRIGRDCFIGANSSLVAPLNIHDNSMIAAGSVIVKDVPKESFAIAREKQIIKENFNKQLKDNKNI